MKKEKKKPDFDPDFSPQHIQNRNAAEAHDLTYDSRTRQYRDSEGFPVRDKYGQKL